MATLNGLYIFVESEDLTFGVDVAEHTVETGIDIADHIKRKAITMALSGEVVGKNAASTLAKLKQMQRTGVLCKYNGRNSFPNCIITDFSTGHPNTVWGGATFSMTLKEVRTASTSYKKTKQDTNKSGTQQVTKKSEDPYVYHTVKKGDTIWGLVAAKNAPYKKYGMSVEEVLHLNESAFSIKGNYRTLQIGKKIIVGKRS